MHWGDLTATNHHFSPKRFIKKSNVSFVYTCGRVSIFSFRNAQPLLKKEFQTFIHTSHSNSP